MDAEPNRKITAEDVKDIVRRYADQDFPGWACASVAIRVGGLTDGVEEVLLVLPLANRPTPSDPLPPAS